MNKSNLEFIGSRPSVNASAGACAFVNVINA